MHDSMFTVPRLLHLFVEFFLFFSGSSSYRSGQAGSQVSPANESSTGTPNPYFPKVKLEPNYYLLFVNCFCVKDRITELVQIKIVEHSI